jgi:PAS domain S-box-containing protein
LRPAAATTLAVALALLLNLLLRPWIGANTFPMFLAAVGVAAWYGGPALGLAAAVLSALVIRYVFIEPTSSFALTRYNALRLGVFLVASALVSWLADAFRRAQEARRTSEHDYRLMVEHVRDYAIFLLDPTGRVASWNEGAERLLGYSDREILGAPFDVLFPPEAVADGGPQWEMETALRDGRADDERWHVRKDASRFWASGVLTAVPEDDGRLRGFVKVMRDITQRKRAEDERDELLVRERQARAEVEAVSRAKDRFLAALSHELRTPLTPVLMAVSALESDPGTPEVLRGELGMVRRNVEMEARLIDDLLDLTRIAQSKLDLKPSLVDMHALVREAIGICRRELEAKRLEFSFRAEARQYCVQGDGARLQQVIWNLLRNAIKFTPSGGRILVTTTDREGDRLRVEVADTGIGIPSDVLPRIFDAFEQGDPAITLQFGGLGLGLAISRALVEAHGGTLTASSPGKDRGSTFTVELTEAQEPEDSGCTPTCPEERGPARSLRILLVDDHADTLGTMARMLRRAGHEVTTAASVASALEAATSGSYDLLISDVGLPDGSGVDLMRRLHPLPGIALTGYGMESDVAKSREAGFLAHLTKPVDPGHLEGLIRQVAGAASGPE